MPKSKTKVKSKPKSCSKTDKCERYDNNCCNALCKLGGGRCQKKSTIHLPIGKFSQLGATLTVKLCKKGGISVADIQIEECCGFCSVHFQTLVKNGSLSFMKISAGKICENILMDVTPDILEHVAQQLGVPVGVGRSVGSYATAVYQSYKEIEKQNKITEHVGGFVKKFW